MSRSKKSVRKKKSRGAAPRKKVVVKKKAVSGAKVRGKKKHRGKKKSVRGKGETVDTVAFEPKGLGARSGGQSGDVQGLSRVERAGSESVEELLEEGNAFEAEVVKGVEDASDPDEEEEVTTHEVPEDDVPEEYREER